MTEAQGDPHQTRRGNDSSAPLVEQLAELSTITGGLAHEIRNPLSTLKVNLQLLDEDWKRIESPQPGDDCDPREIARRSRARIATLVRETNRLEQILQDFTKYVGRPDLKCAPHDLNEIARELADFYGPQAAAANIGMTVFPSSTPMICNIDPAYLKQTILNLLINAQQAMSEGGDLTLSIHAEGEGDARIDVTDTGPGIPPDQQAKVFAAYYSTKKGGTGLGLATAQRIVRALGGSLRVHSQPPHGATFSIVLPRVPTTPSDCD